MKTLKINKLVQSKFKTRLFDFKKTAIKKSERHNFTRALLKFQRQNAKYCTFSNRFPRGFILSHLFDGRTLPIKNSEAETQHCTLGPKILF